MPYKISKQKCKQSSGKKGKYVLKKKDTNEKVSCHTSKEKAKSAMRARYANEQYTKLKSLINLNEEDDKSFDEYLQDALGSSQESQDTQVKKEEDPEEALKKFLSLMGTKPTLNKDIKKIEQ